MCRKIVYLAIMVGMAFNLVGCSSSGKNVSSIEGLGHYSFDLLEQINTVDLEKTVQYFASTNDIKKYLSETVTGEQSKNPLYSRVENDQADWPNYLYDSIYTLRREAAKLGIEWNKLIYLDFVVKRHQGEGPYKGELFLKYGSNVYSVVIEAIDISNKYYMTNLSGIQKVNR